MLRPKTIPDRPSYGPGNRTRTVEHVLPLGLVLAAVTVTPMVARFFPSVRFCFRLVPIVDCLQLRVAADRAAAMSPSGGGGGGCG